jgi:hypothetical protein
MISKYVRRIRIIIVQVVSNHLKKRYLLSC